MSIFHISENSRFGWSGNSSEPQARQHLRELVTFERRKRSLRHEMFDSAIINDPCWHILEELYAAHLADCIPRSKSSCDDGSMAPTTLLRYLDHLENFGLITRSSDPTDSRVRLVQLTDKAVYWMENYYLHLLAKNGDTLKRVAKSMEKLIVD